MKVLVTGGGGFLGSHLVDKLIERGDKVVAIDNLLTGSKDNLRLLQRNPNFQFLEFDITHGLPEGLE